MIGHEPMPSMSVNSREYPDEGKIKFGPSVRIAYLPQIVEFDVPERNLVDTMLYSKRNITPHAMPDKKAV